jgi:hypothetical protein
VNEEGNGADQPASWLTDVNTVKVQEIVEAAGAGARAVHQSILARLNRYLSELIDRALARVRLVVTVADRALQLDSVEVVQTLTLSGSLKVSIEEVCALTAEGQISVNARYSA